MNRGVPSGCPASTRERPRFVVLLGGCPVTIGVSGRTDYPGETWSDPREVAIGSLLLATACGPSNADARGGSWRRRGSRRTA